MNLSNGEIIHPVRETHTDADFIDFLKILNGKFAKCQKIRIVLDNCSTHTSRERRGYLAEHPGRFEFIFTPKHGSWLNMIEEFFDKFARGCMKGIRVGSREELVRHICRIWVKSMPTGGLPLEIQEGRDGGVASFCIPS